MNARCNGCRPLGPAKPSIVTTSLPSSSKANSEHELTALPSSSTVHAPQISISHERFVPVRFIRSRRKSIRSSRAETSAPHSWPFKRNLSETVFSSIDGILLRGPGQGTRDQRLDDLALVFGRPPNIFQGLSPRRRPAAEILGGGANIVA